MLKKLIARFRPSKGLPMAHAASEEREDMDHTVEPVDELHAPGEMALEAMVPAAEEPASRGNKSADRRKEPKKAMAAKGTTRSDYELLVHPDMLDEAGHRKLLLVGHSAWASLDPSQVAPETMVAQLERKTKPALASLLSRKGRGLRVALDHRLFERGRTRYALALDGYLAWGLSSATETTVLLGGVESSGVTYLDVLVFQDRTLVSIEDRELPAMLEPRFEIALRVLLEEMRKQFPGARVVAAAPLPDWQRDGVEYLGTKALRGLRFAPISARSASAGAHRTGAILVGAGVLMYCGLLAAGWHHYSAAGKEYRKEAADPRLQEAGGVNNAKLELQQKQRAFMEAPRPQMVLAERSRRVVSGVASVPGLRIVTVTFAVGAAGQEEGQFGPAVTPEAPGSQPLAADFAPARPADVHMVVEVPISALSAMEQAKGVMAQISANTGLSLRLTPGGWNDDVGLNIRRLTIEGSIQ